MNPTELETLIERGRRADRVVFAVCLAGAMALMYLAIYTHCGG